MAALLLAALILSAPSAEAAYGYRKKITLQGSKMNGSLSGFPVLVNIASDNDLRTAVNGGHVQNSNGYDITFRDSDGTTQLAHQVEKYIAITGQLIAWVKVPSLAAGTNKDIYIYYGDNTITSSTENKTAVWDSSYKGVWHLNNSLLDSTANNNNGSSGNVDAGDTKQGIIGDGVDFTPQDGTHEIIQVNDSSTLTLPNDFTLQAWAKFDSVSSNQNLFYKQHNGDPWFTYYFFAAPNKLTMIWKTSTGGSYQIGDWDGTCTLAAGNWYHIAFTRSGTNAGIYVNGNLCESQSNWSGTTRDGDDKLNLGANWTGGTAPDAVLDEIRVSESARSQNWLKTEYNNQSSPSTFYTIGAEENIGGPVYHQITATAGTYGTITPSPSVQVEHGSNQTFTVTVTTGYQVSQALVNGAAATLTNGQYTFSNVQSDQTISVAFEAIPTPNPPPSPTEPIAVPGCAMNININYGRTGFVASDFEFISVDVTPQNTLLLNTGYYAIDPNRIVIPFTQQVAVTFFYEGAGYMGNDFGWMLASGGAGGAKNTIYTNINDNNSNGILDDRESLGVADPRVNRVELGTFQVGTEIVFWLFADPGNLDPGSEWYRNPQYFYTKKDWNSDTYTSYKDQCTAATFTKIYQLGANNNSEGQCLLDSAWMPAAAVSRLKNTWGMDFKTATQSMTITHNQKFPHVVLGVPRDKPNEWILGWEDLAGGGDTDHNDLIFHIERRTGGRAVLAKPIVPQIAEAYYTGVTATVFDYMPCAGKTDVKYYLSIDNGANWVPINSWDEMRESDINKRDNGPLLTTWTPGTPPYT
ncbi:MAG: DUF2341 domain-containing protein, partial [Deltaproteobacteria bacterium]